MREFNELLQPDQFYVYVDKASLKEGVLHPGHIACFLTEEKAPIIVHDTFVSLRNGDKEPGVMLSGRLAHDTIQTQREHAVYKIKFYDCEEELKTYFFDRAISSFSPEKGSQRFLINIQRRFVLENLAGLPQFRERLKKMKQTYCAEKLYILIGGIINDGSLCEPTTSFNCVNGFYGAIEVEGKIPNPSPQIALWSFLKLVLGEEERDRFIANTGLRVEAVERCLDDDLKRTKARM